MRPFALDELLARVDRFLERSAPDRGQERLLVDTVRLTRRELEVLQLLADGYKSKEIARQLGVSRKTVSTHIQNILMKLNVHTQAQAVVVAYRSGLINLPDGIVRRQAGF